MGIQDGWRFCPRCGGDLVAEEHHLRCTVCGERYWANALPAVQCLIERDGRVLLARRGVEPRRGHWDLPGGFVEEGEWPEPAVRREVREETGLEVEQADLVRIDIEPYGDRFVFSVTYRVRVTAQGEPVADDDVAELRWFAPEELPDEMAFPGQESVLADFFSGGAPSVPLPMPSPPTRLGLAPGGRGQSPCPHVKRGASNKPL